ncbi:hypothetical protein Tco_0099550 [Tanacetum coccineum]
MVWQEDMIKWNKPHDLESTSDWTNSQENQHTTSQDLGMYETSEDKNVGDISGIPVMVEDVTVDVSPSIPLSTKVVQFLQEEPSAESVTQSKNEDVAYDESVGDEFSCGTSIAEVEAGYVVFRALDWRKKLIIAQDAVIGM